MGISFGKDVKKMADSSHFNQHLVEMTIFLLTIKEASMCAFVIDSWDYNLWDVPWVIGPLCTFLSSA